MFFNHVTKSLALQTLTKMAVRVAFVVLASSAVSYFHVFSILESQTRSQLEKYVTERGQRETSLFTLAQDNLVELKKETLRQLKERGEQDPREEFNKLFVKHQDGVTRNRSESFDYTRQAGLFIDPDLTINADIRRRVLNFYHLANAYGPAWKNRFASTYFVAPENFSISYWPTVAIAQGQPADSYEPGEEYFWVADEEHNPKRKTVWTGVYYDPLVKAWMVSCISPIYVGNRLITIIGHDVLINELIKRTVNDQIKGTYNIIFRPDGRLIAHPQLMKKIEEKEGEFNLLNSDDEHLKSIFQRVKGIKPGEVVVDHTRNNEYLAVTTIPGPDWYFVTVFPKSILSKQAFEMAHFILILGFISLLVEVAVLFRVLRVQVTEPLRKFIAATKQIASGNFNTRMDTTRQDELGHLVNSFNVMAQVIAERDARLADQNIQLEKEVKVRTKALAKEKELSELKSNFITTTSHEFRTPLAMILSSAELMQKYNHKLSEEKKEDYLQRIQVTVKHMTKLLSDVLLIEQAEADKLEFNPRPLDLTKFCRDLVEETQLSTTSSTNGSPAYTITFCSKGQCTNVCMDEKLLRHILINLLSNAIKYSPTGSTIRFDLTCQEEEVIFRVQDEGIGIPAADQANLFDSFHRASNVGTISGTGLGLAIVKKSVDLHGGQIAVKSEVSVGTTFTVTIPLDSQMATDEKDFSKLKTNNYCEPNSVKIL